LLVLLALLAFTSAALAATPASRNFVATLSGADEVPARDTAARGAAFFHLNNDESSMRFVLIAANIDNVVAAHIHCGTSVVAGPVGVNLFTGGTPGSGRFDGVLASGEITGPNPPNPITGAPNPCGWTTLDQVLTAMRSGNTYVNVHTNDGDSSTSNIPGDFPGGEIRGQLFEAGATP
jgi:hypothetical protein